MGTRGISVPNKGLLFSELHLTKCQHYITNKQAWLTSSDYVFYRLLILQKEIKDNVCPKT